MIKQALEYLVGLGRQEVLYIDGVAYTDKPLSMVHDPENYEGVSLTSIDGLLDMVAGEINDHSTPLLITVRYNQVRVHAAPTGPFHCRPVIASASRSADLPMRKEMTLEQMIPFIQTSFFRDCDQPYLLGLLSRITKESIKDIKDNGVTQVVTVRTGIDLRTEEKVRAIVTLRPDATFPVIERPEVQYLLRIDDPLISLRMLNDNWTDTTAKRVLAYLREGFEARGIQTGPGTDVLIVQG